MSYIPLPGSNIWKILQVISNEPQSIKEIKNHIDLKYPEVPYNSLHTHLNFLEKKHVIQSNLINGSRCYQLRGSSTSIVNVEPSLPYQYLNYLKSRVGETLTAQDLNEHFKRKKSDSLPATLLGKLKAQGGLKLLPNTKPYQYVILPEIEHIIKIDWRRGDTRQKNEVVKSPNIDDTKNIASMSIGDILTNYVNLKEENSRLKAVLRRIASELMSEIEIDQ